MSKFHVGDKVRILDGSKIENYTGSWSARGPYGMDKHVGEVHTIRLVDEQWNNGRVSYCFEDNDYIWDERGLELAAEQKIVITTNGKNTVAKLYEGKKVVKVGAAICSPHDEFDFNYGASLALDRLTGFVRGSVDQTLEVKSDLDKFLAGEIGFKMPPNDYDAFLKWLEEKSPKLRWATGSKPTKFNPGYTNYFVIVRGSLCHHTGNDEPCEVIRWVNSNEKPSLDWNKFAHGQLDVKVSKENFDSFMNQCEAKNFIWKNMDGAKRKVNPWQEFENLGRPEQMLVELIGYVPGEYIWISFDAKDDSLKWSSEHNEDCDEYEFI